MKTRTTRIALCYTAALSALLYNQAAYAQNPKMDENRRFEERMKSDPIFRQEIEELLQMQEDLGKTIDAGNKNLFTQRKVAKIRFLEAKNIEEKITQKYKEILGKRHLTTMAAFSLAQVKILDRDFEGAVKDYRNIIALQVNDGTTNEFPGFGRGTCLQYAYAALMANAFEEAVAAYNRAAGGYHSDADPIPLPTYLIKNKKFDRDRLMALIYTANARLGDSSTFTCDGRQNDVSAIDNYFKAVELQKNDPIIRFYCAKKMSYLGQYQSAWHVLTPLIKIQNVIPDPLKKPVEELAKYLNKAMER